MRWWLVWTGFIWLVRPAISSYWKLSGRAALKIRMSYSSPRSHRLTCAKGFSTNNPLDFKKSHGILWPWFEVRLKRPANERDHRWRPGLWGSFYGKRKTVTERKTAAFKSHGVFTHGQLFIVDSYTILFICRSVSGIKHFKNYLSIFMLHWFVSLPANQLALPGD